ncbi:hypothetical protein CMO93_03450 [Candidatus Woesearchaeota archaeon]|nr:hypothetical protein [Candidatus Woesearchaeota archaeon]|tara:strand:+ start:17047 stop:17880 length:834 start_codon:yes stop_codon:yes gene_type:complete
MNILKKLSIANKILVVLVLILAISFANFVVIKNNQSTQVADGAIIDAAGRNRMLSQKIGFFAELTVIGSHHHLGILEDNKETLESAIKLYDDSFHALKYGGIAPGIANDRVLPSTIQMAHNEDIMPIVLEAEELWNEYKKNADIVANEPTFINEEINPIVYEALEFIEENNQEMLRRNNEMVKAYVKMNDAKLEKMNNLLIIFLVLSVLIVIFGYFVGQSISRPIEKLTTAGKSIAEGNINTKLPKISSEDEIGELNDTMTLMVGSIRFLKKSNKKK